MEAKEIKQKPKSGRKILTGCDKKGGYSAAETKKKQTNKWHVNAYEGGHLGGWRFALNKINMAAGENDGRKPREKKNQTTNDYVVSCVKYEFSGSEHSGIKILERDFE